MGRKYINLEEPPLFKAIAHKDRGRIRDLLQQGADVNERIPAIMRCKVHGGATPLMLAAEVGHPRVLRDLLAAGADVNAAIALDAGRDVRASLPLFSRQGAAIPPPHRSRKHQNPPSLLCAI